jgi:hypothetical protein
MIGKKLLRAMFNQKFSKARDLMFKHRGLAYLTKDPFWLLVLLSAGAHAAFWLLLPNPIKTANDRPQPEEIEVVSVVPVVDLPAQVPAQSIAPVSEPLTSPPLDLLANADLELNPADSDRQPFDRIPDESDFDAGQLIALNNQEPELLAQDDPAPQLDQNDPKVKKEPQPSDRPIATPDKDPGPNQNQDQQPEQTTNASDSGKVIDHTAESDTGNVFFKGDQPNPAIASKNSNDRQTDHPNTGSNTDALPATSVAEQITASNQQAFLQVINDSKYKDKLVVRVIAPAETAVKSEHREPKVDWIPLDLEKLADLKTEINNLDQANKEINIALLVSPSGTVEKSFIETSEIKALDLIISDMARGYYDKFEPFSAQSQSGLQKYRYVTIKYELDQFNFD